MSVLIWGMLAALAGVTFTVARELYRAGEEC